MPSPSSPHAGERRLNALDGAVPARSAELVRLAGEEPEKSGKIWSGRRDLKPPHGPAAATACEGQAVFSAL